MNYPLDLGKRKEDYCDWVSQSSIFSEAEINLFKKYIKNTLAFSSNSSKTISKTLFIPSKSQAKVLEFLDKHLKSKSKSQIKLLITGEAGSGKSFVQNCIYKILKKHKKICVKAALTGYLSYRGDASTLHKLFSLGYSSKDFRELLEKPVLPKVIQQFSNVEYILVDECFLLGCAWINFINQTLQKIKKKYCAFGGVNLIFIGDITQLACCGDKPFYTDPENLDYFCKQGSQLYRSFVVFNLEENHRIKEDKPFHDFLRRLRYKKLKPSDYDLLRSRLADNLSQKENQEFEGAIHIFPTNQLVENHNCRVISSLGSPVLKLPTIRTPAGKLSNDFDLYLTCNCRVLLTRNLLTSFGLVNGRSGSVKKIVYSRRDKSYPAVILVAFDSWEGDTVFEGTIPIPAITETFRDPVTKIKYKVKRFPLRLFYGSTLHRIQGGQFPKICIFIGKQELFSNYSYTLCSRTSKLSDIKILDRYLEFGRFSPSNPRFLRDFEQQKLELIRIGLATEKDFLDSDEETS